MSSMLTKKDPSVRVVATDPHLVSLGGGRLSTAVTIHYIQIGKTTIGSSADCSISLKGSGVQALHCSIKRSADNDVSIVPETTTHGGARTLIDGKQICKATKLTQGAMITIGNSNYLRFNNPDEAMLMRSAMGSNERISMPQIDFTQQTQMTTNVGSNGNGSDGRSTESLYDSLSLIDAGTALESSGGSLACPKVFASNSVTVSMPARDVLGQKYASFAKNLSENHRGDKNSNQNQHNQSICLKNNQLPIKQLAASFSYIQNTNPTVHCVTTMTPETPMKLKAAISNVASGSPTNAAELSNEKLLTKVQNATAAAAQYFDGCTKPANAYGATNGYHNGYAINSINNDGLEDMLKICTEYADRQNQSMHSGHNISGGGGSITSSPIVQNRIKTNGSLPRDKKTATTVTQLQLWKSGSNSNLVANQSPQHQQQPYGTAAIVVATSTSSVSNVSATSGYENVPPVVVDGKKPLTNSVTVKSGYENVMPIPKYVPQSPRTKIRTTCCVSPKTDHSFIASLSPPPPPLTMPLPATSKKPIPPPKPTMLGKHKDYEQLIQSFALQLQLEIDAIKESSNYKPANVCSNKTLTQNSIEAPTMKPNLSGKPTPAPRTFRPTDSSVLDAKDLQDLSRKLNAQIQQYKSEIKDLQATREDNYELAFDAALLAAEKGSTSSDGAADGTVSGANLADIQQRLQALHARIHSIEAQRNSARVMQENQQAKLKQSIEMKQDQMQRLRQLLDEQPDSGCLKGELVSLRETLETERKLFEDLEFQYFEEDSEFHATYDELKKEEQQLTLEYELAITTKRLSAVEAQLNGCYGKDAQPVANSLMSQSLFGSAELLSSPAKRANESVMSKSINENLFYNNKIELPIGNGHDSERADAASPANNESNANEADKPYRLLLCNERLNYMSCLEQRVPSQDDIERSCRVAADAPISTASGASTKILESIREIERNRKLLLTQQGHHVIELERQRMIDLKKKSHDEARSEYLRSTAATTADEEPTPFKNEKSTKKELKEAPVLTATTQDSNEIVDATLNTCQEVAQTQQRQQLEQNTRECALVVRTLAEFDKSLKTLQQTQAQIRHSQTNLEQQQQPTATNSRPLSETCSEQSCDLLAGDPYKSSFLLQQSNASLSSANNRHSTPTNAAAAETSMNEAGFGHGVAQSSTPNQRRDSTNSNETSNGTIAAGSASNNQDRKRHTPKHQRPLTRYLPIFSPDLDLRLHIETAGHQIDLCPHVLVDANTCRGYLHKLGATFHVWSRRWFVLDRQRNAFIYYSDKSERKPRGGAYFSTIDEVYLDHLNSSKSGRPHCTFIVKTKKRCFNLQAASDAAARIWIDAIITGAQGNLDY